MKSNRLSCLLAIFTLASMALADSSPPERDTIKTSAGIVQVTFIGHGTLMFQWDGKTIHVDPYSRLADYKTLPKADLILITHHHGDHLDTAAIAGMRSPKTVVVLTAKSAESVKEGTIMKNGDVRDILGIKVEAIPAYNLVHMRPDGTPFHPKGEGNGYVLTIGKTRIYIAGDTENSPEMKALRGIDVAFLPMNLPYTMTPEMVVDAAKGFKPRILYPYHYGETDPSLVKELLKGAGAIDIRIRKMK